MRTFTQFIKTLSFTTILLFSISSQAGVISGDKWGDPTLGTSGGEVTWSLMDNNINCTLLADPCVNSSLSSFMPAGFMTELEKAFSLWSSVADITFKMIADGGEPFGGVPGADIRIGGYNIDGPSGTLAHAFQPEGFNHSGDIHFDISENWGINTPGTFDFFSVALHEIGHSIGLKHSLNNSAVLAAGYSFVSGLDADDILTVQSIYGPSQIQASVPEPSSIMLFLSMIGLVLVNKRTKN